MPSLTPPAPSRLGRLAVVIAGLVGCAAAPDANSVPASGAGTALSSVAGNYLAGNFALDRGEVGEAAAFYAAALRNGGDGALRRDVFLLHLASGDTDAALEDARALFAAGRPNDEALLLLAVEDVRSGAFEEARAKLALVGDGGIPGLVKPFLLAWDAHALDDAAGARAALARGDSVVGSLKVYHLGVLDALTGRRAEAEAALRGLVEGEDGGPQAALGALGALLARDGRRDEAIALYRRALARDASDRLSADLAVLERGGTPSMPFDDAKGGMADALLSIAEALARQAGGAQSLVYARLAALARPDLAEAPLLIGQVFAQTGNEDRAIDAFRAVPEASPLAWTARLAEAQSLHAAGREDEARGILLAMADERPADTDALVTLGDLMRGDERYVEAARAYSRAVERLGTVAPNRWNLLYARGIAFERTKRWPLAEADFLKALELEPEQPAVLNYLGYSWIDRGENMARAEGMIRRAVELRPDDGFIVDSLGWVFFKLGRFPEAVERLERAVELEPSDPTINDHLGDAYWRVGREREARFQWRRALTLEPEPELAPAIREKLRAGLPERVRAAR